MSTKPIVYGAPYSVYVRAVCLTLAEKDVAYQLVPVDVFSADGPPIDHLLRQPFGRIPAFQYRGFHLYETGAITRYIDEVFQGLSLQPGSPEDRARVNQVISILDSYAYRTLVWDIYVERVSAPKRGRAPDETRIEAALPQASTCLLALEQIMGAGPFLAGSVLTLADLHAAPMFAYFTMALEAQDLLAPRFSLQAWWKKMAVRASMAATTVSEQ
jgi:glutathione S-transferase